MKQILEDAAVLGIPNVGISLPLPSAGPTAAGWTALSQRVQPLRRDGRQAGRRLLPAQPLPRVVPCPDDPTKRGEDVLLRRPTRATSSSRWTSTGRTSASAQSGRSCSSTRCSDYAIPHRDRYKLFHVKDGKKDPLGGYTDAPSTSSTPARAASTSRRSSTRCSRRARTRSTSTGTSGSATTPTDHPRGSLAVGARELHLHPLRPDGQARRARAGVVVAGVVAAVTDVAFKRRLAPRRARDDRGRRRDRGDARSPPRQPLARAQAQDCAGRRAPQARPAAATEGGRRPRSPGRDAGRAHDAPRGAGSDAEVLIAVRRALAALLACAACLAAASPAAAAPPRVLVYSGTVGFRHISIDHAKEVIGGLATSTGQLQRGVHRPAGSVDT